MLDPHHIDILAVYQTVIQKEKDHRKALVILLGVNKVQELRSRIVGIPPLLCQVGRSTRTILGLVQSTSLSAINYNHLDGD